MKVTLLPAAILTVFWLTGCNGNVQSNQSVVKAETTQAGTEPEETTTIEPSASGQPIHLTRAEFLTKVYDYVKNPNEWVFVGDKPCIIDFYADWCKPCKMVAPIMVQLAEKYNGKINIYKINTDVERELAQHFSISSIPTILFCPVNGKPQMTQGALPRETFEKIVNEVLLVK